MGQAFTRRPKFETPAALTGKNYITPDGLQRLIDERQFLLTSDRPAVVEVVSWAAGKGDRSENADYQYEQRRLHQLDSRIWLLAGRIEAAVLWIQRRREPSGRPSGSSSAPPSAMPLLPERSVPSASSVSMKSTWG